MRRPEVKKKNKKFYKEGNNGGDITRDLKRGTGDVELGVGGDWVKIDRDKSPGREQNKSAAGRVTLKILNDVKPDIYFRPGTHMSSLTGRRCRSIGRAEK